jgi:putative membrane protein
MIVLICETLVLIATLIDLLILRKFSTLANLRRVSAVNIISSSIISLFALFGLLTHLFEQKYWKLLIFLFIGIFLASSFRLAAARVLTKEGYGFAVSFSLIQPFLSTSPLLLTAKNSFFTSLLVGLFIYLLLLVFIVKLERKGEGIINFKPLDVFRAFMLAWANDEPSDFEKILEGLSSKNTVRSNIISINDGKEVLIVVPGVHPGPISKVGSSNLPQEIFAKISKQGKAALVLHSISGHELNLPSRKEVKKFLKSLNILAEIEEGNLFSYSEYNFAEVSSTCLRFGNTVLLLITQVKGGEDLPNFVKEELESYGKKLGFVDVLVVDCHNAQGKIPDERKARLAVEAGKKALDMVRNKEPKELRVGFVHSSEINVRLGKDVALAGIGTLLFNTSSNNFFLVIADANNCIVGLRERLSCFLKSKGVNGFEICTSDTHYLAGKSSDPKGYLALGEDTSPSVLENLLGKMLEICKSRLGNARYKLFESNCEVMTVGIQPWEKLSQIIDRTLSFGRKWLVRLGLLLLALTVFLILV